MTTIRKILFLWLMLCAGASFAATGERISGLVTVTNNPITSNTIVFTAPASKTIRFTNSESSATVSTGLTVNIAATNLFRQLLTYGIGSTPALDLEWVQTNSFRITAAPNANLAATISGSPSADNWASLVLSTNLLTPRIPIVIPLNATSPYQTNWTNVANGMATGMATYATVQLPTNTIALSNFVSIGYPSGYATQRIYAPKLFDYFGGTNIGISNGVAYNLTNLNPVLTNGINYSNAFRSEGIGGNSLQLGSNAQAKALRSTAIGADAFATNTDSFAAGTSAIASNVNTTAVGANSRAGADYATALGESAQATNTAATAIGSAATAGFGATALGQTAAASGELAVAAGADAVASGTNTVAIGTEASATGWNSTVVGQAASDGGYTNCFVYGRAATATTNNQFRLGRTEHIVSIPGRVEADTSTNNTFTGTNVVKGDWSWQMATSTSLANGNNIAAFGGTNVFLRIDAGPTAAFSINGIQNGRDGKDIFLYNNTGQTMTIANESGVDPTPANRILTGTGADVAFGAQFLRLTYDGTASRWRPWVTLATATNAMGNTSGAGTNGTFYQSAGGPALTVDSNLLVKGEQTNHLTWRGTNNINAGWADIFGLVTNRGTVRLSNGVVWASANLNTSAGTATTTNAYAGKVRMASGNSAYYVTNSLVTANSMVIPGMNGPQSAFASAESATVVAETSSGLITLRTPAAPDADVDITWMLLKP